MNALVRLCLFVLITLGGAAPGLSLAERAADLPPGSRIVTAQELLDARPAASVLEARWLRLAERGSFEAITGEVEQGSDLATELALAGLVRQLRDADAGRGVEGAAFLGSLSGRAPRLWMRHEETRGDWFVPAVDPGGEAASALWVMAREQARERWRQRLLADPGALDGFVDEADARSAAEALRMLPEDVLGEVAGRVLGGGTGAVRPSIPQDERGGRAAALPGVVLLALAEGARSAPLYRMALARLEPAERVVAVATLADYVSAGDARVLLQELATDPALGSAAVMALGRFAADPTVTAWLVDALGTPRIGASAAAALARHGGEDVVATLEARMAKDASPALWRDLALALRLHGSPEAIRALQRVARDPRLPANVAAELKP